MKAILFPGQGSQIVGMGNEFYNNFDTVKEIFHKADEKIKFKLSKIFLEGPESELKKTQYTQPAILLVSYSIFTILKDEFKFELSKIKYFAGHSLGEYSALLCSNSISFTDAIYLLHERGKAMQESVPIGEGAMIAVLGTEAKDLESYISEIKNKKVCEIANDNAIGQIIVSGDANSINDLQKILKANKKKSILLPVSAPFHCSLMLSAANKMKEKINAVNFKKPDYPILSNVTAKPELEIDSIKRLLFEQIYSKVRWREIILYMAENSINEFIEIGPGKVLSGLVKRIVNNANTNSINTITDIKNLNK